MSIRRIGIVTTTLMSIVLLTCPLRQSFGQEAQQGKPAPLMRFDAISIRQSGHAPDAPYKPIDTSGGQLRATNCAVIWLIQYAYGFPRTNITGWPDWLMNTHYDIWAKNDSEVGDTEAHSQQGAFTPLQLKIQALLVDRFHLKVHTTTKSQQVYALVRYRNGSGPQLATSDDRAVSISTDHLYAKSMTMSELAKYLYAPAGASRQVIDHTGMPDRYNVKLDWKPDNAEEGNEALPDIFTALKEQMSLKLVQEKDAVQYLNIDSVDHPTAN